MTAILRNRRLVLVACCAAFVGVAAGCGGGGSGSSSGVPDGDVALVAGQPITKARLASAVEQYNRSAEKAKQPTVHCCSGDYWNVVQQKIVPYLVQRTQFEQQAKKLGVTVTAAEIDDQIKTVVKQYFNGSRKKFLDAIKKQGSTLADVRDTIFLNVLQQNVTKKLTANIKVTDKEARDYYDKNKSSYEKPTSRDLAHILVKTKAKAEKIYQQLKNGADFGKLAEKNSTDSTSAVKGGKLGVQAENALVKPFSTVAFKLKTGEISKPVHTQFGWHVIKALGPVIPHSVSPFSKEKAAIITNLKQAKVAEATSAWQSKVEKFYATRVKYAKDYALPTSSSSAPTSVLPTSPAG
jgi:parvulin-like peptidyl-prolyl isomerase